jgi:hypothetical protein
MRLRMRVPSRTTACVCFGLSALWATVAGADVEVEMGFENTAYLQHTVESAQQAVDWTSLFLAEFAVGGPIDNPYCDVHGAVQGQSRFGACPNGTEAAPIPDGVNFGRASDEGANGSNQSQWSITGVFETQTTPSLEQLGLYNEPQDAGQPTQTDHDAVLGIGGFSLPQRSAGQQLRGNQARPAFGGECGSSPQSQLPTPLRPGEAATEILKLRRTLGVNPIAGTIFDTPAGVTTAWAGDAAADNSACTVADDRCLAEAIRVLEAEQEAADQSAGQYSQWPVPEAFPAAHSDQLRPAERKLEEAADLLEKVGQYERADAIRELARQVRQDARQCERQAQKAPVQIFSELYAR